MILELFIFELVAEQTGRVSNRSSGKEIFIYLFILKIK